MDRSTSVHPAWDWGDTDLCEDAQRVKSRIGALPELPSELQQHYLIRRGIIFGQRNIESIIDALEEGRPFAVVTGMLLHRKMHFGTKCVIDQLRLYQELGADIFIAFSDTENWLHPEGGVSIRRSINRAMEEFLLDCLALGLKPELRKLHMYSQWSRIEILCLALALSRLAPCDNLEASSLGMAFFPMIVAADILHPQLTKYGGPRATLAPIGLDQLDYIDAAHKVIEEYIHVTRGRGPLFAPSVICHRMLVGTDGEEMTSKRKQAAVRLHDEPEVVRQKLMKALTGEHEGGRIPYRCSLYELLRFHDPDDDYVIGVYERCVESNIPCETCKEEIATRVVNWIQEFQTCVGQVKRDPSVIKFMLEQDILRETEAIVEITEGLLEGMEEEA